MYNFRLYLTLHQSITRTRALGDWHAHWSCEALSSWPLCILSCSYISNSPLLCCLLVILLSHWGNRSKQKATLGYSILFTHLLPTVHTVPSLLPQLILGPTSNVVCIPGPVYLPIAVLLLFSTILDTIDLYLVSPT